MKSIRLRGIAASWKKFRPAMSIWRTRFAMGSFASWINCSGDALFARLLVNHDPAFTLPFCGGTFFTETGEGLEVSFCIRTGESDLADGVLLALRHGYFFGLSVSYIVRRVSYHCDRVGKFVPVYRPVSGVERDRGG